MQVASTETCFFICRKHASDVKDGIIVLPENAWSLDVDRVHQGVQSACRKHAIDSLLCSRVNMGMQNTTQKCRQ